MPRNVYLVISRPPAGVSDEDYSEFYETHVAEILQTEGFLGARRYRLGQAVPGRPETPYRHLSIYLLDGEVEGPLAALGRQMTAGQMTVPDWFGEIGFWSFEGRPLEDAELDFPDHAYLVLSHAPRRFSTEEYYGWYYAHARENLTSDGFDGVWRFALNRGNTEARAPSEPTHAALYEVHAELAQLRHALDESFKARRVDVPGWMPEGDFTSFDCNAVSAARYAAAAV